MRLVAASRASLVIFETHPETITPEAVRECLTLLGGKSLSVELGVESMDPFVRLVCINKSFDNAVIERALTGIHRGGASSNVNLFVGAPFLSRDEQITDAVVSVDAAFAAGADHVILFPSHIKPHTLVAWMYERGMYERLSLWSLVDVLARLQPRLLSRVHVAWLEPKDHPGAALIAEATTCPRCIGPLLDTFDRHDRVLSLDSVAALDAMCCACRPAARAPEAPLRDRIAEALPPIGAGVLGDAWWSAHGEETVRSLDREWARLRAPLEGTA